MINKSKHPTDEIHEKIDRKKIMTKIIYFISNRKTKPVGIFRFTTSIHILRKIYFCCPLIYINQNLTIIKTLSSN